MKTALIYVGLFGNPRNVAAVSGRYQDDCETRQYATYRIENGVATITNLEPLYATHVQIPFPLCVPVNDLGSGLLQRIDIDRDTLQPLLTTCPSSSWANSPLRQLPPPANETPDFSSLLRNYSGLL